MMIPRALIPTDFYLCWWMSSQSHAVPGLCCIVTRRSVDLVGGLILGHQLNQEEPDIRGSSASSQATCSTTWSCLLDVHRRCLQPVHTPHLLKYRCYAHATSLVWMQQSLGVRWRSHTVL